MRADLRTLRGEQHPQWLVPTVAFLSGVMVALLLVLVLRVNRMEDRIDLNETWVRTHRHDDGAQPPPEQFKQKEP